VLDDLRSTGKTIIFATHDLLMAERSADVCVLLNRRVIAAGPPAEVLTVQNLQATFGGPAALITEVQQSV
jgi:ABC-type Mn2+/Zn2+ transport system ATPase subunit